MAPEDDELQQRREQESREREEELERQRKEEELRREIDDMDLGAVDAGRNAVASNAARVASNGASNGRSSNLPHLPVKAIAIFVGLALLLILVGSAGLAYWQSRNRHAAQPGPVELDSAVVPSSSAVDLGDAGASNPPVQDAPVGQSHFELSQSVIAPQVDPAPDVDEVALLKQDLLRMQEELQQQQDRAAQLEKDLVKAQAQHADSPVDSRADSTVGSATASANTPARRPAARPPAQRAPSTKPPAVETPVADAPMPQVRLISIDMWNGQPSVVVGTTDAALGYRVMNVGDSSRGITLQSVDVDAQTATFLAGGKPVVLRKE